MQPNQMEWLDRRLELLNTASVLALEDCNPDNKQENAEIIDRCKIAISTLLKVKQLTVRP